nr:IS66 family insertion sequence element accessory protein TnpB [Myxococcus sp. MH1]
MLLLPRAVRILLARESADMRNSIDGLAAIVRAEWKESLYAGHLFVFVSRRGDKVKILSWDAGGFVLTYKRLEQARFRLPAFAEDALGAQLDATQLSMLLDGIDVTHVRRPGKWAPPPGAEATTSLTQGGRYSTARGQTMPWYVRSCAAGMCWAGRRARTARTREPTPGGRRPQAPSGYTLELPDAGGWVDALSPE